MRFSHMAILFFLFTSGAWLFSILSALKLVPLQAQSYINNFLSHSFNRYALITILNFNYQHLP